MHVERLMTAPVKGLGLERRASVLLTERGVTGDRRYALVDERARMVNGKRLGPLVRVRAEASEDPEALVLVLPDGTRIGGEVGLGAVVDAVFYGEARPAREVLGDASEALSALAGERVRLVRLDDGHGVDRVGDGAVSLQTTASLGALARELGRAEPLDGRRFRMTITVDGASAYAEDDWIGRRLRVGEAVLVPEGNVGRCAVTNQDPDTGRPDAETLAALARVRGSMASTEPLPFGVHARVLVPGIVREGDPVTLD